MADKLSTLHDLFIHDVRDLYSAEQQLLEALPKMADAASNSELKQAFQDHLAQTEEHVRRLEQVGEELGFSLTGEKCLGMDGLIKEAERMLKHPATLEVLDVALIGAAQKVEHYEIGGYGTVATFAELMEHEKALELLAMTLEEEEETDEILTSLAEGGINEQPPMHEE